MLPRTIVLLIVLLLHPSAPAQTLAEITGQVVDPSGSALAGASITVSPR
jgi:hypothetical protein